ncbi:unnamed protein product [Ectocarpus sp. 13 AM-2016]
MNYTFVTQASSANMFTRSQSKFLLGLICRTSDQTHGPRTLVASSTTRLHTPARLVDDALYPRRYPLGDADGNLLSPACSNPAKQHQLEYSSICHIHPQPIKTTWSGVEYTSSTCRVPLTIGPITHTHILPLKRADKSMCVSRVRAFGLHLISPNITTFLKELEKAHGVFTQQTKRVELDTDSDVHLFEDNKTTATTKHTHHPTPRPLSAPKPPITPQHDVRLFLDDAFC